VTAPALWSTAHGGGLAALWIALLGWAALTALASGVVRGLRLAQHVAPAPPIAAAGTGALMAGLVLGDVSDGVALASRLGVFVAAVALVLVALQRGAPAQRHARGCRAGLFDCSLPAWPASAWRDTLQWPTLLAGLAMLPMMAALPWMAAWCRAQSVPPQAMVLLHLGAMFGPVWLLRAAVCTWSLPRLSSVCAALLALGAAFAVWAPAPHDLLGLALAHGAAWGLAWGGQLWAPARRGQQGTSPLRAAAGYALLTLAFGVVVERFGVAGVAAVHAALGAVALAAWGITAAWRRAAPKPGQPPRGAANEVSVGAKRSARVFAADASARTPAPPAAHPDHRAGGR
jgi:hypothetical protein